MNLVKIEAALAIAIFSFVPVSIKFVSANPMTIGIFRLLMTCIILSFWWRGKINGQIFKSKEFYRLILLGLVFFGHWITYFFAIKIGGASACVLGMCTYGVQLLLYGSIFLGYHLRPKNYIALIVVLIGLVLVLPKFDFANDFSKGVLLGLISAAFYSSLPIIHQRSNRYFDHEVRIFFQFFFSFICFLFLLPKSNWHFHASDWAGLIFLAIPGTVVAHTLWTKVTSQIPTYISGILYYMITPMSLILSRILFKEYLSTKQIIGATLILTAAIYNVWSSHDKPVKS